jgi:hypothetical protein
VKSMVVAVALAGALGGVSCAHAGVAVQPDRTSVTTSIGEKFSFRTTIRNIGRTPASDLVAHLNVLSLRPGTYVDPEDWSSHRTRYLQTIDAGGSLTLTWNLQAVNSGVFGVYVAVLPASGAPQPPNVSPTVRVAVAHRQTLNSGGIVPLALGLPAVLCLLTLSLRMRRRMR